MGTILIIILVIVLLGGGGGYYGYNRYGNNGLGGAVGLVIVVLLVLWLVGAFHGQAVIPEPHRPATEESGRSTLLKRIAGSASRYRRNWHPSPLSPRWRLSSRGS